jgi:dTDP-4-dehydrorhamnose reductase
VSSRPTYVPDLAHVVLDTLIDGGTGVWHMTNPGAISWRMLADRVARQGGLDPGLVSETQGERPQNTALTSERGLLLPPLDSAIDRFFNDCEIGWVPEDALVLEAAE